MKTYINGYILKLIEEGAREKVISSRAYYNLADAYPNRADLLTTLALDELKHHKILSSLYEELTDRPLTPVQPASDQTPDLVSMQAEEADAATMYRTIYFALSDTAIKNQIFEIMTDDMLHTGILSSMV